MNGHVNLNSPGDDSAPWLRLSRAWRSRCASGSSDAGPWAAGSTTLSLSRAALGSVTACRSRVVGRATGAMASWRRRQAVGWTRSRGCARPRPMSWSRRRRGRNRDEPGAAHMREALERGIPVVTSDKWPMARFGTRAPRPGPPGRRGASGGVDGDVRDALAGPVDRRARRRDAAFGPGVVNATANSMLTNMARAWATTRPCETAQTAGLAEPDPSADVDGHDSVAKAMILAGLVFGAQLDLGARRAPRCIRADGEEMKCFVQGGCVREVMSLEPGRAATMLGGPGSARSHRGR